MNFNRILPGQVLHYCGIFNALSLHDPVFPLPSSLFPYLPPLIVISPLPSFSIYFVKCNKYVVLCVESDYAVQEDTDLDIDPYCTVPHLFVYRSPRGSPSHGGDVAVYIYDINQPSLPTPFHSVLVSVSVFKALSTVFHFINSSDNSPFSHSVLPVSSLPYWSFQLYVSL